MAKHNSESKGCISSVPSAEDLCTLTLLLPQQHKSWVRSGFQVSSGFHHVLRWLNTYKNTAGLE